MAVPIDDLIVQFREGSEAAFKQLYNIYFYRIYCFSRAFVGDSMVAEDITAELFIKLWQMRGNFESRANLEAFLHVAARNASYNHLDMERRKMIREKDMLYRMDFRDEMNAEIEAEVITRIRREVDKLPPTCKRVFELSFFEGYGNGEIAKLLAISDKTVRNLKTIALKTIKTTIFNKDAAVAFMVLMFTYLVTISLAWGFFAGLFHF